MPISILQRKHPAFRELISPIADNALQFYNYYLYEEFIDDHGHKVLQNQGKAQIRASVHVFRLPLHQ